MTNAGAMNNPPFGPFGFAQGPEPVETRNQDFQFIAGAYSRILKIRE
jgi:hypothetical protein